LFKSFPKLDWSTQNQLDSVNALITYVSDETQETITWYLDRKNVKKRWAQYLRVIVIILTTLSALVPLLAGIVDSKQLISPIWSSVALVLAVALIGLDRFFGFSSAWMRFISTEVKLRQALHVFLMDCEIQRSSWQGATPDNDQITKILQHCKVFMEQIDLILESEINIWMKEFQSVLKDFDAEIPENKAKRHKGQALNKPK